jgi:hypothetical protein
MPPEPALDEQLMRIVKRLPAHRRAPLDLFYFPSDSAERFIDRNGTIPLSLEDIPRLRFDGVLP